MVSSKTWNIRKVIVRTLLLLGLLIIFASAALAQPVTIMPTGDSITHGFNSNSYRKYLELMMSQAECNYEMAGNRMNDLVSSPYESLHSAYSGHTAADFVTNKISEGNPGIATLVSSHLPDVITLHIGSNDLNQGASAQATLEQITEVLKQIDSGTTVLLANLIPWPGNSTTNGKISTLRTLLSDAFQFGFTDTVGNNFNFPNVHAVDVNSEFNNSTMIQSDGIHPTPTGDEFIAGRFFEKFVELGLCNTAAATPAEFTAQLQNIQSNECLAVTQSSLLENADTDSQTCSLGESSQTIQFMPATTVDNSYQLRFMLICGKRFR